MEKPTPNYEKMAEEYAKIRPLPFPEKQNDLSLVFDLYARIYALVGYLPEENAAKEAVSVCKKQAADVLDALKALGIRGAEENMPQRERTTYTSIVRRALLYSAKGIFIAQKEKDLPLAKMQSLHLFLLTLTAF